MNKNIYEIESDIPVGDIVREPKHPLWDLAKKMKIGDCVSFNARCFDEKEDAKTLMRFLNMLYGITYNKKRYRPYFSKTDLGIRRIWRIDANDKIKEKEVSK